MYIRRLALSPEPLSAKREFINIVMLPRPNLVSEASPAFSPLLREVSSGRAAPTPHFSALLASDLCLARAGQRRGGRPVGLAGRAQAAAYQGWALAPRPPLSRGP